MGFIKVGEYGSYPDGLMGEACMYVMSGLLGREHEMIPLGCSECGIFSLYLACLRVCLAHVTPTLIGQPCLELYSQCRLGI